MTSDCGVGSPGLGITEVVSSPRSPWQNAYIERAIGSLRRECLNHVIVLNEAHLRRILRAHLAYYHRTRTHLALQEDAPDAKRVSSPFGTVVATSEVGGLHHRYKSPRCVAAYDVCTRSVCLRELHPLRNSRAPDPVDISYAVVDVHRRMRR